MSGIIPTPEVLEKEARVQRMLNRQGGDIPVSRDLEVQSYPFLALAATTYPIKLGLAKTVVIISTGGVSTDRSFRFGNSGQPIPVLDAIVQLRVPWGIDAIALLSPTSNWTGYLLLSPDPGFEYDSQALTMPLPVAGSSSGVVFASAAGVTKYWSPTALGINNAATAVLAAPDGYGARGFMSNIIDMTGMRSLTVQVRIVKTVLEAAAPTWNVWLLSAFDPWGVPDFGAHNNGGGIIDQSLILIDTGSFEDFVGTIVANRGRAWDVARGAGSGNGSGLFGPLGPQCRIWIDFNVTTVPGNQTWSVAAVASS